ncbi:TetR/AcrR family transcriptional regulator, partial [Pedobacter sp. HMWF019]|uniref:TetR/AcrR family transcriptional regulator n=1 Tax=Pedobacter sp. HMWF019 TaxID=2056856 RepID=UPI000D3B5E9D
MTRKITSGPIRNKERTKSKLLKAVGAILKKEGFAGLNVSRVASKADVHRKLIYEYFGGMENLVREYLNNKDYWRVSLEQIDEIIEESKDDFGKKTAYILLESQFDALMENEEMRKIINWGLSEDFKPLTDLNKERERLGEEFFSRITDDFFRDKEIDLRAVEGLLIGGIYYLTLQAKMSGETMCGIDINTLEGQEKI